MNVYYDNTSVVYDDPARGSVGCPNTEPSAETCIGCPFAIKHIGHAGFLHVDGRAEKLEHHVKNLGGFPCHHLDGNDHAFSLTEPTVHPCRGWLRAGGNWEAVRKRFLTPINELSQFEQILRSA